MSKRIDITGKIYGRLKVLGYSHTNSRGKAMWKCVCECGTINDYIGENLRSGGTSSCGCLQTELSRLKAKEVNTTHGLSGTRLYNIWRSMKKRCYLVTNKDYKNYGAKGVSICDEWMIFENFAEWAISNGYSDDLSIDRINVYGNYEPLNCRWENRHTQCRNVRVRDSNLAGYAGVRKCADVWEVRIKHDNKSIYIGRYKDVDKAIEARKRAELKYWG